MRGKLYAGVCLLLICGCLWGRVCRAEISGDDALKNLEWELVYEEPRNGGVVQSICTTGKYVLTLENVADDPNVPDIVSAYERTEKEVDGKKTSSYKLVNRVQNREWEHCNGMTYNPKTDEVYVALYTNTTGKNRGSLYVMDPNTLEYKRTIKVSDDFNLLGIGYLAERDQYVIQTNVEGGYSIMILNPDFTIAEDLGEFADTAVGDNFQDLTVSGDYIINFPLTLGTGTGDMIHMYSISRKEMVASEPFILDLTGVWADEPESLCEVSPGIFLAAVDVEADEGGSKVRFYETNVPYKINFDAVSSDEGKTADKLTEEEKNKTNVKAQTDQENAQSADDKGAIEKTEKKSRKHSVLRIIVILIFLLLAAFILLFLYAYTVYIRRIRKKKERARKRRRERDRQMALKRELE